MFILSTTGAGVITGRDAKGRQVKKIKRDTWTGAGSYWCQRCNGGRGKWHPPTDFRPVKRSKSGRHSECYLCEALRDRMRRRRKGHTKTRAELHARIEVLEKRCQTLQGKLTYLRNADPERTPR